MILKKIITLFIIVLISSFFIIDRVFAQEIAFKSCCVCTTNVSTGGPVPTFNQVVSVSSTITDKKLCDDMSSFFLKRSCVIGPHKECGVTESKVEPTMTKLGEEFGGFKDVILGVTIPGLQLSAPPAEVDEEGNIYISWIGEYLKALYNFSVVMISIIGIVVIILMGIKIITSGGGPAKGEAYKRISQAVIGLFIAWGSYAILFAINPNLTVFKSLQIMFIPTDPLIIELQTTTEQTSDHVTPSPISGSYTRIYEESPINFTNPFKDPPVPRQPAKDPRNHEFWNSIDKIVLPNDTIRQKIVKIADAAAASKLHFGSCGRIVGTIYALAGVGGKECLTDSKKYPQGCRNHEGSQSTGLRGNDQAAARRYIEQVLCENEDRKKNQKTEIIANPCAKDKKEAVDMVWNFLVTKQSNYPDVFLDRLEPGDAIIFYNANQSYRGTHAAIFLGWGSGGKAQIIDGSENKFIKHSSVCLRSNCNPKRPILFIYKPRD